MGAWPRTRTPPHPPRKSGGRSSLVQVTSAPWAGGAMPVAPEDDGLLPIDSGGVAGEADRADAVATGSTSAPTRAGLKRRTCSVNPRHHFGRPGGRRLTPQPRQAEDAVESASRFSNVIDAVRMRCKSPSAYEMVMTREHCRNPPMAWADSQGPIEEEQRSTPKQKMPDVPDGSRGARHLVGRKPPNARLVRRVALGRQLRPAIGPE